VVGQGISSNRLRPAIAARAYCVVFSRRAFSARARVKKPLPTPAEVGNSVFPAVITFIGREFGTESFDDHFDTKSVMVARRTSTGIKTRRLSDGSIEWNPAAQGFLRVDFENNTEARLAAHHPVIGFLGFLKRKNLVHRCDVVELTE
jgi:hypothetical protein